MHQEVIQKQQALFVPNMQVKRGTPAFQTYSQVGPAMAAKPTAMALTSRITTTAPRYAKNPTMLMNADSARSGNRFTQISQPSFKRFSTIKMTAPQMKGGITQGAPTNFQLAVQKKQNEAKIAVGAGVLATAMSFFNPAPAMAADIGAGEKIFEGNCAACHAGGQNVIQNEKTLQKDALVEYLAGGFKETSIVTQVTNGKGAMPAFGGKLGEDDIANVAAYVYDQSNGDKWE